MVSAFPPDCATRKSANTAAASSLAAPAAEAPISSTAVANRVALMLWPTPAGCSVSWPAAARSSTAGPKWPVSNGQDGWQGSEK